MEFKFEQCTIQNSQIGNENTMYNNSLTDDDWEKIRNIFEQKMHEDGMDLNAYRLLNESQKYITARNEKGIKNFVKAHAIELSKNIFYNITSTSIIALLSKIGIYI